MRLQDRVVLVTGAGGTIGREVSRLVAEHGARLAVTDMAAEPLEVLMGELRQSGSSVWGRSSDVADFEDFSALVAVPALLKYGLSLDDFSHYEKSVIADTLHSTIARSRTHEHRGSIPRIQERNSGHTKSGASENVARHRSPTH